MLIPEQIPYAFQPIYNTKDGNNSIYGYEALIRPKEISPTEYVEKMIYENRMHELEYISFYNATKQFIERGYTGKLFINSFPCESLNNEELAEIKKIHGKDTAIDIIIENLEYNVDFNIQTVVDKVTLLRKHGYKIALDDFCSGINSLEVLEKIKPDIVKIDRHFVTGCLRDSLYSNVLAVIIYSLQLHDVAILAEGVETKEEYEFLKKFNIDYMQGFYLGKPE